jgi:release factor glutamine methyltransferase
MMIIKTLLREAEDRLRKADVPDAYAKYVLNELLLNQERNLYLELDQDLDEPTLALFSAMMDRLMTQEPLAYVLGYQVFLGYPIEVNPSVLIPRPETEELVLQVLMTLDETLADVKHPRLIDIGTGSGAIAIALKKEESRLEVLASDISEAALNQAQHNAKQLDASITWLLGSLAQPLIDRHERVDVIVCNPPYIPQNEAIEVSVKDFEPHVALFGGEDGLDFYRQVLDQAPFVLNQPGFIAFEIGWNQKDALTEEAKRRFPESTVTCYPDMAGKDRILIIKNK